MKKALICPCKKDQDKTHDPLLKELAYLRAQNTYLKKLKALIQEEEAPQQKRESSQD